MSIGVFDSGIGGLTVLKEAIKQLPTKIICIMPIPGMFLMVQSQRMRLSIFIMRRIFAGQGEGW